MYVHNLKANATSSGDMLSVATTVTSQYHLGFKDMVAKQQKARMVAVDNQGISSLGRFHPSHPLEIQGQVGFCGVDSTTSHPPVCSELASHWSLPPTCL